MFMYFQCMCIHVYTYMGMYGLACMWRSKTDVGNLLQFLLTFLLGQGHSLNSKLANSGSLAIPLILESLCLYRLILVFQVAATPA